MTVPGKKEKKKGVPYHKEKNGTSDYNY